jgi:hypothetical protein
MAISDLKRKRLKFDSTDLLPLSIAGLSIGMIILSFVTVWLAISYAKLSGQKPPTLVQQVDGRAFTARLAQQQYREPEVNHWAIMTFTWGKPQGQSNPSTDEGKVIAARKRVPTSAWEASFLLSPDFRDRFLQQLASEVVPEDVFKGQVAAVLVPQNYSQPVLVGDGRWRIDLIATRMVFDAGNPGGRAIPFNRSFYVKAVQPPDHPLGQQATEYQRIVYSMLESGLQIEEIRPMEAKELVK